MSGSITVPTYPVSNRVPGVFAVVDASKANTGTVNQRTLLIGQMLTAGSATAASPVISAGLGDAQQSFGAGSQLAIMVERYRALDTFGELWCLPLADGAGAAATATIAFTGTATAAGTIALYINGVRIAVPVNVGDAAAIIASSVVTAIGAYASPGLNPLDVTAVAATGTVTLTARNKGTLGNQGDVRFSYYGISGGDGAPAGTINIPGVTATITPFAGGTTDPTVATALVNLADAPFDFICCPYSDTVSLTAVQSFLGDAAGRWNWASELFGHCFSAISGTFAVRDTFGAARNNQHESIISASGSPDPAWHWAVDFTAAAAVSLRADPGLPVGGLGGGMALNVLPPAVALRDTFSERNTLLYDGITTYVTDQSGVVRIERAITTYQTNPGGAADNSYLDLNVPFQLMAYIRAVRSMLQSQFNQVKLVADGSRIPVGQSMVTSKTILYSVIANYRQQADTGLVQSPDIFQKIAQSQNAGGGVVKLLLPVMLANQLYDIAMNVQFTRP